MQGFSVRFDNCMRLKFTRESIKKSSAVLKNGVLKIAKW